MYSGITEAAPPYRVYGRPDILKLIERVYDLQRVDVGGASFMPPFFCSAKPFRGSDVFMLPFQFYRSLELAAPGGVERFFGTLQSWSEAAGRNVTFQTLEELDSKNVELVANAPILYLPEDGDAAMSGYSRNLRSNLKRNANKARRAGVHIGHSGEESDLYEFYCSVLAPQYVRKHRMVFQPYALYRGLFELGVLNLVLARCEQRIVGGLILIDDGDGVHYAWGASETIQQIAVGTLMLQYAIESAIERKLAWFDFGATPLSDKELLAFKLRWGSIGFPVRRYHTLRPPQLTDLNSSFVFARRLFSYLPVPLARSLMPRIVPWLVG